MLASMYYSKGSSYIVPGFLFAQMDAGANMSLKCCVCERLLNHQDVRLLERVYIILHASVVCLVSTTPGPCTSWASLRPVSTFIDASLITFVPFG